jgi:hypothetical protein
LPTFATTARFDRDFKKLLPQERERFEDTIRNKFVPDIAMGSFGPASGSSRSRESGSLTASVPSWK